MGDPMACLSGVHSLTIISVNSITPLKGSQDGGLTGEYGDHSGIMGNSGYWRGVNAPHRLYRACTWAYLCVRVAIGFYALL